MIDKIFTSRVCFAVFLIAAAGDLVVPFFIAPFSENAQNGTLLVCLANW